LHQPSLLTSPSTVLQLFGTSISKGAGGSAAERWISPHR